MNNATLEKIAAELEAALTGRKFGRIFLLSRFELAVDFRAPDSDYLLISIEPSNPRVYLIKRKLRELEKRSKNLTPFLLLVRKKLSNAVLTRVAKTEDERILRFELIAQSEIGETENYTLVAQLTGRSANLYLLDASDLILDSARENFGAGQEVGNAYAPPVRDPETQRRGDTEIFSAGDIASLSEALDAHFLQAEAERVFQAKLAAARSKINHGIAKREKLAVKLAQDLANHGDAEKWKRFGDLLLSNVATAKREGNSVFVTDFFDENTPTIEIEVEENHSLTEAAEKFFKRYTKARNAGLEISKRVTVLEDEIENLKAKASELEDAIAKKDEEALAEFTGETSARRTKSKERKKESFSGARRYFSSEGFEILVGKGSKDNDVLTFRVAKSNDLWLHAADYPGSHVVVRAQNRKEIPPKTLLEAAQVAAFFSKAKKQSKVAVHYTQKKFVNKPKGAALGLVSLASFKTILVEPKIEISRDV